MTLNDILQILEAVSPDAPVIFTTEQGEIGGGYHITELKLASVNSIDCGGRLSNWTEASVELLDGTGETHMAAGKWRAILNQSVKKVAGLGDADLHIEFGLQNIALRKYKVTEPKISNSRIAFHLSDQRALCKPAHEQGTQCGLENCSSSSASEHIASPQKGCCG
jgi:hypothetical protein